MCREVFDGHHLAKCCSKACARERAINQMKQRRQKLKKEGKCTWCGVKHDRDGTRCEECNDTHKSSMNSKAQTNLANGLCYSCGNPNDREGLTLCSNCEARASTRSSNTRQWDKDHGMCPRCRQVNMECNKFRLCAECRAYHREHYAKQRRKKKKQGRR